MCPYLDAGWGWGEQFKVKEFDFTSRREKVQRKAMIFFYLVIAAKK